ncbi:MAG: riboflavin synthase [Prolixibacteraceae bacterium]|nr:riboflavin synthase [Prolixibacteraceae bacterium]
MFSGIVEEAGKIVSIEKDKGNVHFTLTCSFANELKVDQSLSHNGVCLTVVWVDKEKKLYKVTAIQETLDKTNLGYLKPGSLVNLERSMLMNGRLDGHIVQGHVDQTATCTKIEEADGSWYFTFEYEFDKGKAKQGYMTVEKGSVTVDGVSLTVVNAKDNSFQVAIIPYTYEVTDFQTFKVGTKVNLEFDIIGKYVSRLLAFDQAG